MTTGVVTTGACEEKVILDLELIEMKRLCYHPVTRSISGTPYKLG